MCKIWNQNYDFSRDLVQYQKWYAWICYLERAINHVVKNLVFFFIFLRFKIYNVD